jgi:predicted ATPase with chaperone activity
MEPAWEKVTGGNFSLSEYKDSTGRILPMFKLTKLECLYVATKYNDEARAKLVIRWEELEKQNFAEPIGGVLPIIYGGKTGYPRKEIFEAAGYSSNSGMVSTLKRRYAEHFFSICRTACVSKEFAKLRLEQGKVRQLALDFYSKALMAGGSHGSL